MTSSPRVKCTAAVRPLIWLCKSGGRIYQDSVFDRSLRPMCTTESSSAMEIKGGISTANTYLRAYRIRCACLAVAKLCAILLGGVAHSHRNLFWQLFRHEPYCRAPWKVGDTVVGGGNPGWKTSMSGHPCPCQNCSQGPREETTGRESLLNRPSCPTDDPLGQGTELN